MRTVVLNGTRSQDWVVALARDVSGVVRAEAGVGYLVGSVVEMMEMVAPWLARLFMIGGLVLVASTIFAAARVRRHEAEIMRLLGAGWLLVWASLGTVVIVPVLGAILLTTLSVGVVWPVILRMISPLAAEVVPTSTVFGTGAGLALGALVICVGMTQLGLVSLRLRT